MAAPVPIIDTREQAPLPFSLLTERGTLATGDYAVKDLERFIPPSRIATRGGGFR